MFPTLIAVAALTASYEPVLPELVTIPGPYCKIPCSVARPKEVARVMLYVSDDRGRSWALDSEIAPGQGSFTYCAKRPGEYWFTARVKKTDGTLDPENVNDFEPMQRIRVEVGTEPPAPATAAQTIPPGMWTPAPAPLGAPPVSSPSRSYPPPIPTPDYPTRSKSVMQEVDDLDDELTRTEIALLRKEIQRLAEAKDLTPETTAKIDRLRSRLQSLRYELRSRDGGTNAMSAPSTLTPATYVPVPGSSLPPVPLPPIPTVSDDSKPAPGRDVSLPPIPLPPIPVAPPVAPIAPVPHSPAQRP